MQEHKLTVIHRWHPLAITLAELCVQTEGPLVDRAWASVAENYDFIASNIADGRSGSLFRKFPRTFYTSSSS